MTDNHEAIVAWREEKRQTPAKIALDAEKRRLLDFNGTYPEAAFSNPTGFLRCPTDHRLIQRVVFGWDYFYCDDCEHFFEITSSGVNPIPKQHFPGYCLQGMLFYLRYFGGDAMAAALVRPHADRGKDGNPQLPPIAGIVEHKEDWAEMQDRIPHYLNKLKALDMGEHQVDQDGLGRALEFFNPDGHKELADGSDSDGT